MQKNEQYIQRADKALRTVGKSIFKEPNVSIPAAYNGAIASFGVTVVCSGLLPALAIYCQTKSSATCDRRKIVDIIASMLSFPDREFRSGDELFKYVVRTNDWEKLSRLKREVIACSIALKQVVRTYEWEDKKNIGDNQ